MKDIVIIYHGDCPDGFGGAWAAHKKFGDKAEYIGVQHSQSLPAGLEDKEIYTIDFAYSVEIMEDLIRRNKRVTAIDHHVTREEAVKITQDYSYSIDNSGAILAWKYFHKDEPIPPLLEYIEDQDLFKFKLKDTLPIVTFLESLDYSFSVWDKLTSDMKDEVKVKEFIEKGNLMVNFREELIKRLIDEHAKLVEFEDHKTYIVNAPHEFASRIGEILYSKNPPLAIVWQENKDGVHVSLRSDGSVDVGKLAQKFGGGGHKSSSGFSLPAINSFPWKNI